jgi:predicted nucleotidyltransferase
MNNPLDKAMEIIIRVADPDKIILFGSRAREINMTENSDYDLLVLKRGLAKQRKLAQEIYLNFENIGAPIDVIVTDLDKYEELKKNPYMIYIEAHRHGKIIYEKHERSNGVVEKGQK